MTTFGRIALVLATFVYVMIPALSQTPPPKPSFEVVSIKPSPPNLGIRGGGPRGDRFTLTGATLKMILQNAYQRPNGGGLPQIQIIGGPGWMDSDRFEIEAKADCNGGVLPREQLQLMIQSMLEDRFQLKAHLETRDVPVYNLVVAKDGPKIKPSADQTPFTGGPAGAPQVCGPAPAFPQALPPPPNGGQRGGPIDFGASLPRGAAAIGLSPAGMTLQASGIPIVTLTGMLQQTLGRPVIDKTDLKGLYDFKLQFSTEGLVLPGGGPGGGFARGGAPGLPGADAPAAADPLPSVFSAIQDLGFKLDSARGPVEVLVVDSAQKPTEN